MKKKFVVILVLVCILTASAILPVSAAGAQLSAKICGSEAHSHSGFKGSIDVVNIVPVPDPNSTHTCKWVKSSVTYYPVLTSYIGEKPVFKMASLTVFKCTICGDTYELEYIPQ